MRYLSMSATRPETLQSRINAERRLTGRIGFAEQETQDNATKDSGRHHGKARPAGT